MIYREETKKGNFVQISKDLVNDNGISVWAKSIMMYLLAQNNDFQFYEADITKHFKNTLPQIRKGIKELIEYGLLIRTKIRVKGKFIYVYEVFETKRLREAYNKEQNMN